MNVLNKMQKMQPDANKQQKKHLILKHKQNCRRKKTQLRRKTKEMLCTKIVNLKKQQQLIKKLLI